MTIIFGRRTKIAGLGLTDIGWRKTFDEAENDFSAYDGETYIGRVYLVAPGYHDPHWGWFTAWGGPHGSGKSPSRREAMLAIEEAYAARLSRLNPLP
ncbi:hypothetical protein L2331_19285 [Mesorhizobium muleiense]|nr:hypothetical protein [Mesorhizobium muleiense]